MMLLTSVKECARTERIRNTLNKRQNEGIYSLIVTTLAKKK
jgi:hypothetical protein